VKNKGKKDGSLPLPEVIRGLRFECVGEQGAREVEPDVQGEMIK